MEHEEKTLINIYKSNDCMGWHIMLGGVDSRTMLEALGALRMAASEVEKQILEIEDLNQ